MGKAKEWFKSHFKKSLERFCMTTEMHGWLEMYTAKSTTWRVIWIFLICTSVGFTIFHIHTAVVIYMDEPTVTMFQRAKSNDLLYPPLRLCYDYWFRWVDWKKALALNYSEETLLYSFSFINTIFTENDFDVDEAATNFSRLLKEYNFNTITKFYKYLVKPVSWDTWGIVHNDDFLNLFQEFRILSIRNAYYFCIYVSSEQMQGYFKKQELKGTKNKWIQFDTVDESYQNFKEILTKQEYSEYMKNWVDVRTVYVYNRTSQAVLVDFAPTVFLSPNSYSDVSVDIVTDNYFYFVDMSASASKWKNTNDNICLEGQKSIAYNDTCEMNCQALAARTSKSCRMLHTAGLINEDFPEFTCPYAIRCILNGKTLQNGTDKTNDDIADSLLNVATLSMDEDNDTYNECIKDCVSACELWDYSISVSNKQMFTTVRKNAMKKTTSVTIAYPETNSVILMVETDAQTWDSFLGNIGGLLGIWTGASLLSFIQMFYLCCCADIEGWTNSWHPVEKIKMTRKIFKKSDIELKKANVSTVGINHISSVNVVTAQ